MVKVVTSTKNDVEREMQASGFKTVDEVRGPALGKIETMVHTAEATLTSCTVFLSLPASELYRGMWKPCKRCFVDHVAFGGGEHDTDLIGGHASSCFLEEERRRMFARF
jgi:hypothetical protein